MAPINIFEYKDYRELLDNLFSEIKDRNPKVTHRSFNKALGFNSPNFVLQVIQKKKNLTEVSAERIAKALDFSKDEIFYFKNLVLLNQSTTIDERQMYAHQMLRSRGFKRTNPLAEAQYKYFTHWYYVAIKEMSHLPDFSENPEWIANRLFTKIPIKEIEKVLKELISLGFLKRNKTGKVVSVFDNVLTPDEVVSPFVAEIHREFITLGGESITRFHRETREIFSLTFPISRKSMKQVKDILQRFKMELAAVLSEEKNPEAIYQANMQLFPIAPFID